MELVTLASGTNIQYICTIVCVEELRKLDMLSIGVVNTTSEHLKIVILDLGTYFFLLMCCQKKKA